MVNKSKISLSRKQRFYRHLGDVGIAIITSTFLGSPAVAVDQSIIDPVAVEGGKEALNQALKVARTKPALSVMATIVSIGCIPVAGAAASPAMCIACGILVAKVLG